MSWPLFIKLCLWFQCTVWVVSPQNRALPILFSYYQPAVINQGYSFFPSRRHLVMSGGTFDCHNWQGEFYQYLVGRGQGCCCTNATYPLTVKNYQVQISIVLMLRNPGLDESRRMGRELIKMWGSSLRKNKESHVGTGRSKQGEKEQREGSSFLQSFPITELFHY